MADVKITALTAIGANPVNPATFPMPMVDLLDPSQAASGSTRKVTVNQILGAGGTATLASATITGAATVGTTLGVTGVSTLASAVVTGALTVDTTTLVVDATNDRVGVNTATFDTNWGPKLQTSSASTDGSGGIVIESYKPNLILKDASSGAQRRHIYADGGVQYFGYGDASIAEHLSIGTTGNVSVALGNVVIATSGKGIDFSAVTGGTGTATANVLNDYEEGTWVGTLKGATTDPTIAVTAAGRYTKIGRQVNVQLFISNVVTTGASGGISIAGLPFSASSGYGAVGTVGFYEMATFTGSLFAEISSSGTTVGMYSSVSNSVYQPATHNAGINRYLWLNVTYTV